MNYYKKYLKYKKKYLKYKKYLRIRGGVTIDPKEERVFVFKKCQSDKDLSHLSKFQVYKILELYDKRVRENPDKYSNPEKSYTYISIKTDIDEYIIERVFDYQTEFLATKGLIDYFP